MKQIQFKTFCFCFFVVAFFTSFSHALATNPFTGSLSDLENGSVNDSVFSPPEFANLDDDAVSGAPDEIHTIFVETMGLTKDTMAHCDALDTADRDCHYGSGMDDGGKEFINCWCYYGGSTSTSSESKPPGYTPPDDEYGSCSWSGWSGENQLCDPGINCSNYIDYFNIKCESGKVVDFKIETCPTTCSGR